MSTGREVREAGGVDAVPAKGNASTSTGQHVSGGVQPVGSLPFASLGITQTASRQEGDGSNAGPSQVRSKFSDCEPSPSELWTPFWDWIEGAGSLDLSSCDERELNFIFHSLNEARSDKKDREFKLGPYSVWLRPNGIGKGGQARMTYCFDWGDVTIAFANRESTKRRFPNFYFCISGRPCLLVGAMQAFAAVKEMVHSFGAEITDLWPRRVDIGQDMPGVSLQRDLLPSLLSEHFVTTAENWSVFSSPSGVSGFQVSSTDVKLRFYDKRFKVLKDGDEEVRQFMIDRRWHGEIPPHATRFEFEVRRGWLHRYGLNTLEEVFGRVPDIVSKLGGDGPFPFFRLLSGPVDRENRHQSRATLHPLWSSALSRLVTLSGEPEKPLKSNPRGRLTGHFDTSAGVNRILKTAALKGQRIENSQQLVEHLKEMLDLNEIGDEEIATRWEKLARRAGTLDSATKLLPKC